MFKPSKRTVAVTTATFMIAGGGIAFAYWTSGGTGTGSADTGTTTGLVVTQSGTVSGLVPGGDAKDVAFTIQNPSTDTSVKVTSLALTIDGLNEQADADLDACTSADFTVTSPALPSAEIAAGATITVTGTIKLDNLAKNQNNCKGVSVPLKLVVA